MATDTPAGFAQGFLDDFFAEADEHLAAIRRHLLAIEGALPQGAVRRATLEEMLRSIHSLKGISGMVGLAQAEALAHDMESYLRPVRDGAAFLSSPGLDVLVDAVAKLEQVVVALRQGTPAPDVSPAQRALQALVPDDKPLGVAPPPPPAPEGRAEDAVAAAPADGAWRVTFVPSSELLQRGVNVNVVRDRLRGLGDIVEARPLVLGSGIAFEFTLRTAAGAEVFDPWRGDGIVAERIEASAPPASLPRRPETEEDSRPAAPAAASRLVRVDIGRVDDVMRTVADLVVTRGRLVQAVERAERHLPHGEFRALQEHTQLLERQLRSLRDQVMRVRLVPVGQIFSRMPFVVRDLAKDDGKQVRLVLGGQDTEIDKFLIERMMDPILHLVRNAVAHGIETPGDRLRRGKDATGIIGLRASTVGETVMIEVEDDGGGVDAERVVRRAREAGLDPPAHPDAAALLRLLCAPGFSTRQEADRGSGRGVGMGVVKQAVEQLSGTMTMESRPGQGTRFVLTLPLTLAIVSALLCTVGTQRFAVPQNSVREVLELETRAIRSAPSGEIFPYRGAALPLLRLSRLMALEAPEGARLHVFVIGAGLHAVGLAVDRIVGQREIVVRAVGDPLLRSPGVVGATDIGDGKPVLILDPAALAGAAGVHREDAP